MEDRELVRRLLERDEIAQRYLYEQYRDKLYRASVYILGYGDPDAEDVVQEVFLAAQEGLSRFEFKGSLHHWLYRICMYKCYERIHKRKRLVVQLGEELDVLSRDAAMARHAEGEEDRARKNALEILREQKRALEEPCRSLLEMRDERGLSYAEIAESLKIPGGTVMSRLARCKEALKSRVLRAMKELTS